MKQKICRSLDQRVLLAFPLILHTVCMPAYKVTKLAGPRNHAEKPGVFKRSGHFL